MKPSYRAIVPSVFLSDLKFAAVQQGALLLLFSLLMDGGNIFRWALAALLGYWLAVAAIARKRLAYSGRSDRLFVRLGSIILIVLALAIEPTVHRYIRW
jgi:hypothetical protein